MSNYNDLINGSFELLSGLFTILNIVKLVKDKELKGISYIPIVFFTIWGIWNLYYYPSLNQIYSFIGGLMITTVNLIWIILLFYYKWKKN
jgi:hypothetical protein